MMYECEILTDWIGTGSFADPFRPAIVDSYALSSWVDTTGQQQIVPQPNALVIYATCDAATLSELDANEVVLWSGAL